MHVNYLYNSCKCVVPMTSRSSKQFSSKVSSMSIETPIRCPDPVGSRCHRKRAFDGKTSEVDDEDTGRIQTCIYSSVVVGGFGLTDPAAGRSSSTMLSMTMTMCHPWVCVRLLYSKAPQLLRVSCPRGSFRAPCTAMTCASGQEHFCHAALGVHEANFTADLSFDRGASVMALMPIRRRYQGRC